MYKVIPTVASIKRQYPSVRAYYGSDAKMHVTRLGREVDVDELARHFHSINTTPRITASVDSVYLSDFRQCMHQLAKESK